ncbi:MAG: trigger factor [Flavobacteriia bacterium]|nr:trigger factor [Flavobacteriia bacterium]
MIVLKENVDNLNADLIVKINREDYASKVKASLEKYRKTAKIPGFRPGNVPMGMIEKQYGKSLLAEELNKLANDGIYNFIRENKLEILGNPIPKENTQVKGDFSAPDEFEFTFEIGLSPTIDMSKAMNGKYDYTTIKVDEKLINQQVEDLRRRYGKLISTEIAGEKDMVLGKFQELNDDKSIKTDGISNATTISLEFLKDAAVCQLFIGKKIDETFELDPSLVAKDNKDLSSILGVSEEIASGVTRLFSFTITEIKKMVMADLNSDLYAKLFQEGEVDSEESLKARVKKDMEQMFSKDSDKLLTRSVFNSIMEQTNVEFPSDFLKRWIRMTNEKPLTEEDINAEFDAYLKSLKWQLIQTKIFKDNNIKLDQEEVIEYTKNLLIGNYAQYGMPAPDDKELAETAIRLLQNKEQANGIYDQLAEQKLTDFFKSMVSLVAKPVSYDEFVEIAGK